MVIVLVRSIHGWRTPETMPFAVLSHQVYGERLWANARHPYLEIVAVGLRTGVWVTLWAATDSEVSYPQNAQADL